MQEFKGTPGPWVAVTKYVDEPLNVVDSDGFKVVSAERVAILDGWDEKGFQHWGDEGGHRELPPAEYTANSHLIAAAPELLEALQESMKIWESSPLDVSEASILLDCRAAIAKALGQ